jgi:hypothetical protein
VSLLCQRARTDSDFGPGQCQEPTELLLIGFALSVGVDIGGIPDVVTADACCRMHDDAALERSLHRRTCGSIILSCLALKSIVHDI